MTKEELEEYIKYLDECNKDFHKALDRINKTTLNDFKSEMKKLKKDKERNEQYKTIKSKAMGTSKVD